MNTAAAKRYLVEWTPWDVVKAAAVKRGMPADGEVSDYVELDDYLKTETFSTFAKAVKFARSVIEKDTWRCPRVCRQVLVQNDHDDLGNRIEAMPSFETEATWEQFDNVDLTERLPDDYSGPA
jgi:hypothetical protein